MPRERYSGQVRAQIGEYLAQVFQGHVSAYYPYIQDTPLTRVHFIIGREDRPDAGSRPRQPGRAGSARIVRTWTDGFASRRLPRSTNRAAPARCWSAMDAFSDGYREVYSPLNAVDDIRMIETLSPDRPLGVDFYHRVWDEKAKRRPEGLELSASDTAVGARAGAGEHGLPGGGRADLPRRGRDAGRSWTGSTT